ncbi:OmpL47-type beta-barrel domain-containing protein [Paenibacillus sp. JDR-2]|uniref:OmpL47-type beta-barrel domain-containing protein n=1 Tax=Paenibacillus sp. (strain JDR-2) TaxID=324057 RepID=UPI000166653C|nr:Ig-like domain-containing protein [Paenibacillus sp. JDR-2]ACT02198.1 S-layer domain protein [Paenibacillus sp. JDR-2]
MFRKLSCMLLLIAIAFVFLPTGGEKKAFAAVSVEELPSSFNPPEPLSGAMASAVGGNKILLTGGQNGRNNSFSKNSYVFDTVTQTWSSNAPSLPVAYHAQSMLPNGSVLAIGGNAFMNGVGYVYNNAVRIYNPSANAWTNAANFPHTVLGHSQSTLLDGRVLAVGGANEIYSPSLGSTLYNNAYIYNPAADRWNEAAPLPIGIYGAAQSTLKDGRVLLTGGLSGYVYSFNSYIYDPAANTWTKVAQMPYDGGDIFYRHPQVTLDNGKVLVMGNRTFALYDPSTNTWKSDVPNPDQLENASLVAVGSDVYVVGGYNDSTYELNTKLYKLTFDFNPPSAPTITGVGSAWSASDVDVSIVPGTDAETGVNRTEYSLSGATSVSWTPYNGSDPVRISKSGQTTISARTVDNAGNISAVTTAVVKIDRTPPTTPTISLSPAGWSSTWVSAWFSSSSDPGGSGVNRIEYSLSEAITKDWKTYTAGFSILAQGQTTVHVRAVDQVGNISGEGTAVIMIDTAPPAAPAITPASGAWSSTDVTVAILDGTDTGGSGVNRTEYRLTGASNVNWTTYNSPILIGASGQTTVEARTIDHAGNIGTSKTVTVKVDKTQPTAPVVTPDTANWTNAASVKAAVTGGTDTGSGVNRTEYSLSGAATLGWTTYTGQVTISAEGQTTLSARTVDNANNIGSVSATVVKIDRTKPSSPIITPSNGTWSASNVTFTVTDGTDNGGSGAARTEFSLSGATIADWAAYSGTVLISAEGQTTIHARTVDQAGNIGTERTTVVFIDKTKPTSPVITASASDWSSPDAAVTIAPGTDAGGSGVSKTEYKLSGATTKDWITYTGVLSISAEGQTTVEARTTDNAGNTSMAVPVTVKMDKTKPAAPIVAPDVTGWTNGASVKVTVTAGADSGSGIGRTEYSLNGAVTLGWTTYTGQISIAAEGQTTISARTIDLAGNISPVATGNVKLDRTLPAAPAISPAGGIWSGAKVTVTLTAGADNASSVDRVEYKLSGATSLGWTSYSAPIHLTVEGLTTVTARTVDKAGNISEESEVMQGLDFTPPGETLLTPDVSGWNAGDRVTVTATAGTDNGGSGVKEVEYSLSGAANSDWKPYTGPVIVTVEGQTEVFARTVDKAGNKGTASKATVQIDRTAPEHPQIEVSADKWANSGVDVTITPGTDPLSGTSITEYSLTGAVDADWKPYNGKFTVTAEGRTTIHARTVDQAGNISDIADTSVFMDKTAPTAPGILIDKSGWVSADKVIVSILPGEDQGGSGVNRTEYRLSGAVTKDWTVYSETVGIDAEGITTISARTIDQAGNVGEVREEKVQIDRSLPEAPAVVPDTEEWTSANAVMVNITAGSDRGESGLDRTEYRITGAGAKDWTSYEGELSVTAEGESTVSARSIDKAGNSSPVAKATVRIDRTPPVLPVVLTPENNEVTSDNTPEISGTAEAKSEVTIKIDDQTLPAVITDGEGKWKVQPVSSLADGTHHVSIAIRDSVGNASADSVELVFVIDSTAPAAPIIEAPANGAITGSSKPVLKGQAEAGSKVTIYLGDTAVTTIKTSENGIWNYPITEALKDGVHIAKAVAEDSAGNVSKDSNSVSWTVDTKAPDAPVILEPKDGAVTKANKTTISGTAEADAAITIFVDGVKAAEGQANESGAWSITLAEELPDGMHSISAMAADKAGNKGPQSDEVSIKIDTIAPEWADVSAPIEGALLNTDKPLIRGNAEAGAWIRLTLDGAAMEPFQVNEEGEWSFVPSDGLSDGSHQVKVKVADAAGNAKEEAVQLNFVIDTTAPSVPLFSKPDEGSETNQTKPEIAGTAEKHAEITIQLDGETVGNAEAGDDGRWSFVPSGALAIGAHIVQAKAKDAAGNESGLTSEYRFEIVSSNANLSTLKLSDIQMNEPFKDSTLNYTAGVAYSVLKTKVTAVPSDANAKVDVLDEKGEPAGEFIELAVGTQTFTVRVTAQDGTTVQAYTVKITKYNPVSPPQVEPEEPGRLELVACKPAADGTSQFGDMSGHWAERTVKDAYGCGIVHGFNDGTFRPEGQVTRAEFVTMLMNAVIDQSGSAAPELDFSDKSGIPAWAAEAIARAKEFGIVNGYADGSFRPNDQVTRAELVTMLAKAAGIKPLEPEKVKDLFSDASDIPAWSAGYVAALQQAGILQGRGDGKFVPSGRATRAEAAVLLLRMIEYYQN